jgi:hypothetical protein
VVAGQSGNAGAQALAVTMRGLVLREIGLRHWRQVLGKEAAAGLLNGVAVAATTALGVYVWSGSVPAGVSHDPYDVNRAPRVMQVVDDADFGLVVKFDRLPTERYQIQGLMVEQGPNDWLRFDFYHDGRDLRRYVGVTRAGVTSNQYNKKMSVAGAPLYLRVTRTAPFWAMEWSTDGQNWQFATAFEPRRFVEVPA